jgi:cellulose synthase/poly-beta-1,6-N-acetylglucosamine synthase-like glycosyltransferase
MEMVSAVGMTTAPVASAQRFWLLLCLVSLLLALVVVSAFLLPAPWSWAVGLLYIGYESWLTGRLFWRSRAQVRALGPVPRDLLANTATCSLSVLIAARNELTGLPATLAALLPQQRFGDHIIIIDDGSTDGTYDYVMAMYQFTLADGWGESVTHPGLFLLTHANCGKARSLNKALAKTSTDLIMTIDGDTIVEMGALEAVRQAFIRDETLGAACGVLKPLCQHGWSARFFGLYQTLEYSRSYLWRMGWTRDNTLVLVSGAFATFRREHIMEVGGFDPACKVEDYELLFRLYKNAVLCGYAFSAAVIPGARAVTDVPGTMRVFLRQRARWFAGFIETMVRHRAMVGDQRLGQLGHDHLIIKTIDLLLPLYGLLAFIILAIFLISGGVIHPLIIFVLVMKLSYDIAIHIWSMVLYRWWQGGAGFTAMTLLATLCEPILFQPLRQCGAALGWFAYLRGHIEWTPQRPIGR